MNIQLPAVYVDAISRLEAKTPSFDAAFDLYWEGPYKSTSSFEDSPHGVEYNNALTKFRKEVVPQINTLKEALKISETIFAANLILANDIEDED